MAKLSNLSRIAALALLVGTASAAQDPWSLSFKMGGGPMIGEANTLFGNAGFGMGADFELYQSLSKTFGLAYSLGYRSYPGDNTLLSSLPSSLPATNVNPSYFEARNRKTDGDGFQVGVVARWQVAYEGVYVQGGLRLGSHRVTSTDTGTQIVTNGLAVSNPNATNANVLAINTIASQATKSTFSFGLTAGVGYRLTDRYSLEAMLTSMRFTGPVDNKAVNATTAELVFGVRF